MQRGFHDSVENLILHSASENIFVAYHDRIDSIFSPCILSFGFQFLHKHTDYSKFSSHRRISKKSTTISKVTLKFCIIVCWILVRSKNTIYPLNSSSILCSSIKEALTVSRKQKCIVVAKFEAKVYTENWPSYLRDNGNFLVPLTIPWIYTSNTYPFYPQVLSLSLLCRVYLAETEILYCSLGK